MYSLCSYQSIRLPRNTIHKMNSLTPKRKQAFSLVEVSLSLAIIGIAFTVIIGMLPVGLRQSRAATDTTNEARILAAMTSILYATEYKNLDILKQKVHYFDADGAFLETGALGDTGGKQKDFYVYQAVFLSSPQPLPGGDGTIDEVDAGKLVHIAFGRMSANVSSALSGLTLETIEKLGKGSGLKVNPIVVAKMDRIGR